ncbi:bifunctional 2-keto-4-hydroxyglutarate aldolase/2-keto-3-deoxy-6-phosphogluconate aldolase [Thalassobacillus devorans]|uniref:bifunctional 2-keto-4-hydroxyglutarate aldolase/2-keto-3-deoxy-6-phosphogluconate aldolase n=1 Tax=Thalassobacillus devorans TaxID=279813 RepID=UPI00048B7090|nr:bifunctional 2-keto-4-hydroxyglutarate aldolase/2-keto-3-deoxy-6-phosphogluconate aldolase [Thalassobacillus devorans]
MQAYEILKQMIARKLVVVIRGNNVEQAEKTAVACVNGGVDALEVTFTVPEADQLLKNLKKDYPEAVIGAGTVLDSETARVAILAGARFIVSPHFEVSIAKLCNRYHIPYLPGCMTTKEMVDATEYGVSVIKLFPGQHYDPSFIKNIHGPLPYLNIMPTGGVNLENVQDWLNAGAVMVGVGGEIIRPANDGDYLQVEQLARQFSQKVKGA